MLRFRAQKSLQMLLQAGANAVARNAQGKTPADLAKSPDVCDLLDGIYVDSLDLGYLVKLICWSSDYSLFMRRDFKSNERVAAVIRAAVRDDDVSFTVKSGTVSIDCWCECHRYIDIANAVSGNV